LLGAGKTAVLDAGVTTIAEAIELDLTDLTQIGPDLRFTASLRQKPSDHPTHHPKAEWEAF
jgi:diaminohydroxyphosphoribosylaminopyrimidine deaminase/5-amino-6-(5-phosphoribosylamino)uracil reductase